MIKYKQVMISLFPPTSKLRRRIARLKFLVGGFFVFLLINIFVVSAQVPEPDQPIEIPLQSVPVMLENGRFERTINNPYVVIQLSRELRFAEHQALNEQGIRLLNYLVDGAWLASVDPGALTQQVINEYDMVAAVSWQPENKAPLALQQGHFQESAQSSNGEVKLLVTFFSDATQQEMEAVLAQHTSHFELFSPPTYWAVEMASNQLSQLLHEPIVNYVEEGPAPFMPLLDDARHLVNVDSVHQANLGPTPPVYNGLSGVGVNIQVSENVYKDHQDFWNHDSIGNKISSRFINYASDPPYWNEYTRHGTLVAGIIGGNGWLSSVTGGDPYQYRGMAPEVNLYSGHASSSTPIHASNHSYVMNAGSYGSISAAVDGEVKGVSGSHPQRPQIWAVANQGLSSKHDNEEGYYAIYAPAKNAIAIGSVNANDAVLSLFSSLGPTFDGRIKPDVVAPGGKYIVPQNINSLTIDWIRLKNTNTGLYDARWEFNTNGDLEGWFQTPSHQLNNFQVANGYITFDGWGQGYGHNYNINIQASDYHVIEMRYKMNTQDIDDPTEAKGLIYWHVAGDPDCPYVSGRIAMEVNLDNQFELISIPVGTEGLDLTCPGENLGNPGGWSGTIDMLRIDPVRPVDLLVSTTRHEGDLSHGYEQEQGTSFAAPVVTGIVALMLQQFVELHGINLDINPPLPSTIKAILIQTATDLTHETADLRDPKNPDTNSPVLYYPGPDFATGYGLVNARAAVDFIAAAATTDSSANVLQENELDTYMMQMYEIDVAAGEDIRVTLAWDDPAAQPSLPETTMRLINDLDLLLIDPKGNWHYPWTLDPLPVADCNGAGPGCGDLDPISPSDIVPAHRGVDRLNNVEMAEVAAISADKAGTWIVLVLGRRIAEPMQRYSLTSSHPLSPILGEHELNNDIASATLIPAGATMLAGNINPEADADYFAFTGLEETAVILNIDAYTKGAYLDAVLHLYDTDGVTELVVSDDYHLFDPYIEFTLPATGTYYVKVHHYDETDGGGIYAFYQLKVAIQSPEEHEIFIPFFIRESPP